MKNELMAAVAAMSPKRAREMQQEAGGGFAALVAETAQRAAELQGYDPSDQSDPALNVMLREMAMQDALDELNNN